MNILPSSAFLALSLVFCQLVSVSSWMPNPKPKHSAFPHQFPYASITMLAVTSADEDSSQGSLLVSNMHKIGLSTDKASKLRLLLASQSPRRREILDMMGLAGRYTAEPSPLNEEELQVELSMKEISPQDYARTLAERKAHAMGLAISDSRDLTLIIGSDTIVDLDGVIMEKPKDTADAFKMIRSLSGNWHQVHTGVAVYAVGIDGLDGEKLLFSFTDTARVKFALLGDDDIQSYIATKEPMDKAGSYGIQGIGGQLVERMEGDFFTVMGLPMHRLSRELSKAISSLDI
mmetsp:Transcript_4837/g.12156  ORF Transcript_4837/g.12156 Transcript_4837/m.12156 type:complete len:289 (-) Transcript_4837:173-1039(-)|eukprot:CAMPEP_0181119646 /NCGR_PEP_ID=MMETSP1071-20121207/23713_1 /TAXON_ID=35127 /ORGANISM="Thalassiosira sp., Strain NH16" /LENGTH=288 /DNA_ID=CAMNT_0023204207 /DNA_START=72 /DNA_END=938 /DNA_ORIENTATION=-